MKPKIDKNMLRERADKLPEVTDEMWEKVLPEHKELFDEYFEVNQQLSKETIKQYASALKQWFYWVYIKLDNKPMYEISKRDFAKYMSFLRNNGMSSSALSLKKSAVSTLCNYIENMIADDDQRYKTFRNITKGLPPIPKNVVYNKIKVTKEEYELMMKVLQGKDDLFGMAWLATAFNVGARRAEIIQFRTEILNYPMDDGKNYVLSHIVRGKGASDDGKPLEYMINKEALKYMRLWVNNRGFEHDYIFAKKIGDDIRVVSDDWADSFCSNILSYILERRVNPHIFKASCITFLLEQGVDIALVSKYVAQHNDISTTIKHYDLRDFKEEKNKIFN